MAQNDDDRPRRQRLAGLGYLLVFALLIGYFVWLCTQMAGEAPNGIGGGSLIAILVAFVVAIAAAGLAVLSGRTGHRG